ncbi:MAG: hypothetical protein RBT47_01805, partial [Anaerolineae bacterium]|nr:hypothetical protein [Anaerolineae bacterium]
MGKSWLRERGLAWALLVGLPVGLALLWGEYLGNAAYAVLRVAQVWGRGEWLATHAPLYVGSVLLLGKVGVPLAVAAMVLSALGWGVAAIALWEIGRELKGESIGLLVGVLVVVHPVSMAVLGTEVSWVVAWGWLLGLAWLRGARWLQMVAWVGLLGTHGGASTAGLALLWIGIVGWQRKQVPVWESSVLVGAAALNWWISGGWPVAVNEWRAVLDAVVGGNELYWVWVPWMGVGVWALWVRGGSQGKVLAGVSVLWLLLGFLSPVESAAGIVLTVGWFLGGGGLAWSVQELTARGRVRVRGEQLGLIASGAALLVVGGAEVGELWGRYLFRPVALQALEDEAGAWLRDHSEVDARILGPARVGYVAERESVVWSGGETEVAALVALLQEVNAAPPEYCVTRETLSWWRLQQTGWFRDGYEQLEQFTSPYEPTSSIILWEHRVHQAALGEYRPLSVRLPGEVAAVGYQYWPQRVAPGEAVYVTLFLQVTQPLTRSFKTVLQVLSPVEDSLLAQQDALTPRSFPLGWWQPGQIIAERFVLTTTQTMAPGAYPLDMFVVTSASGKLSMYQDGLPVERVTLGYLVVPWEQQVDASRAVSVEAGLGDQFTLLGFEAPDHVSAGETIEVTLYWKARRAPDADYTVFVHLLNADGTLAAGHDGIPMEGRYPTRAWAPDEIVADVHRI